MNELVLQSILGTDKRNPNITLYQEKSKGHLQIYYGAQLLETIPSNRDHINYRAAVGRLYNAGLNRKKLCEVFKVDRKTMQKWGKALHLDDVEEAVKILSGRRNQKITIEIRSFAEVRYSLIYPRNKYSYSREILNDIYEVYGVHISAESLRQIISTYKKRLASESDERDSSLSSDSSKDEDSDESEEDEEPIELGSCDIAIASNDKDIGVDNHNTTPSSTNCLKQYLHHAGILIFSPWLHKINELIENKGYILRQWLAVIFLEAVNIEQSKYLDFDSLSILLGKTSYLPVFQRNELDHLSNESLCSDILRLNGDLVGINSCRDFYYDPHTKHYTGMKKILKGWCSSIRWAEKALHSDFIHTTQGEPVYINYFDNYDDLRERYCRVIASFRKTFSILPSNCITIIVDRGIYSHDVIRNVTNDPTLDLITWEKGFKGKNEWDESKKDGAFDIVRYRNNSQDRRFYNFSYREESWSNVAGVRRLIVCAKNPKKNVITVSILCTDPTRNAQEIIRLIFSRWLQENDFKYLEKHFGINQITSYASTNYKELEENIKDKICVDGKYRALVQEKTKTEKKLKDYLHKQHRSKNNISKSQKELQLVNDQIEKLPGNSVELAQWKIKRRTLKAKIGLWNNKDFKIQIDIYDTMLNEIYSKINKTTKNTSKLQTLIDDEYQRLDIRKKNLMDCIKIYARNIFYYRLQPFKKQYNNYRDDHQYFRNLTHSGGVMIENEECVVVYLNPTAHLQPKTRTIIENNLNYISENGLLFPDGSGRKLVLKLINKVGKIIAIA